MTDYNDGSWHGWNGGECPVHDDSVVEVVLQYGSDTVLTGEDHAVCIDWCVDAHPRVIAFRVTKVHREPREFWVNVYAGGSLGIFQEYVYAEVNLVSGAETIRVREVLDE